MTAHRQNPDGTWSPAEPLPIQPGLDVELYTKQAGESGCRWEAWDGLTRVREGSARTLVGARLQIVALRVGCRLGIVRAAR